MGVQRCWGGVGDERWGYRGAGVVWEMSDGGTEVLGWCGR